MLVATFVLSVIACAVAGFALWRTRALGGASSAARGSVTTASNGALTRVALVRYDAFGDIAGRLSFSAALLDDAGDGIVLSSIHARSESRTYAKSIVGGESASQLTPEEEQAVASARAGKELS